MRIAAVLLAAGAAERFGGPSKLLAPLGGVPLVNHAARALAGSAVSNIIVVTGRDEQSVKSALAEFNTHFIHNPAWSDGLGGSVAAGVRALVDEIDGALIVPGDMPFLTAEFLNALIGLFERLPEPRPIIFPQLPDGTQGNPVLWPKRCFSELAGLSGAAGAKALIKKHAADAMAFPVADAHLLLDIDTQDDLARAAAFLVARA